MYTAYMSDGAHSNVLLLGALQIGGDFENMHFLELRPFGLRGLVISEVIVQMVVADFISGDVVVSRNT